MKIMPCMDLIDILKQTLSDWKLVAAGGEVICLEQQHNNYMWAVLNLRSVKKENNQWVRCPWYVDWSTSTCFEPDNGTYIDKLLFEISKSYDKKQNG